ncbi:MAG: type II toxin-antitoxin system VapC family toxin [Acidobacteriota bacterium]
MEVRVALDTNRLSDLFRGDAALAASLGSCDEVWLPLIVVAEIQAGFQAGAHFHRNHRMLPAFLERPTAGVLLPDRETANHYARVFVQLKRAGKPIPDNDLWIAALCLQHNLALISRDKHFDRVPQLLRA